VPLPPPSRAPSARLALIALLVLLVVLGVHGHFATPVWATGSKHRDAVVAAALEAVLIVLVLVLLARAHRAPPGQRVAATLRTALLYVLVGGALAVAASSVALITRVPRARTRPTCLACAKRTPVAKSPAASRPPGTAGSFHFPYDVFYGLAAAAVVATIVAVSVWLLRQSRQRLPTAPLAPAEEYTEVLAEALAGGRKALLRLDDARAAIIACYVAMEDSLARAGTTRSSAETPDELLAKAAGTLLVSAGAARRLTALFYEARFSSHRLDDDRRAAAESALDELALELGGAEAVGAGAEP